MAYHIEHVDFFVRETQPARFPSALGKAARNSQEPKRVTSPICHLRMIVRDSDGNSTWACSADRLSVRWLDKRAGRDEGLKRRELAALLQVARRMALTQPEFTSPFDYWLDLHQKITQAGRQADQVELTSAFVSSLFERAILDAVCRLAGKPLFVMLKQGELGIEPSRIHTELESVKLESLLPELPVTDIHIRHTVGLFDPLNEEDWPPDQRLGDGLPETLRDYIDQQGIRYFKVKISGDIDYDLRRLSRLWEVLSYARQPSITLDANEAFGDPEKFALFVRRLERENLGFFQHVLFIEQPLPRSLSLDTKVAKWIRQVNAQIPVIIDESDGSLDACRRALELGYAGTSHKNCKGFFKSLANLAWFARLAEEEPRRQTVLSGEDLQNLPIVPLHQDFVSVGCLGLNHCERNGHHYNYGLSMLPESEKRSVAKHHPDLYQRRGEEWFMRIRNGMVRCDSLHRPGYGVVDEPDWASMQPLAAWLDERHPA